MLAPQDVIFFFLGTTRWCAKKTSLSWSEFKLKNKSVDSEKNEKLTFEISIWVKKRQNIFFPKNV